MNRFSQLNPATQVQIMKTKRKLTHTKRFWITILLSILIGWYAFKPAKPWYTEYEGPNITVNVSGQSITTPLRTWRLVHRTLLEINEEGAPDSVGQTAIPLWNDLSETSELLASELPNGKGRKIDFIAMIHPSVTDLHMENDKWMSYLNTSQGEVLKILSTNSYDVIGKESSWSIPFSEATLVEENLSTLQMLRPNHSDKDAELLTLAVKNSFANSKGIDGVAYYQYSNPDTFSIGIENKYAYRFHAEIVSLLYLPSIGNHEIKSRLRKYDRFLVWFRTELAVAKMLKVMREENLSRGVIVMGQAHRHSFEMLSRQFGLESTIYHTVPERVRTDEPK